MSLNFDKTDLINNTLIIYDNDGMPTFIPEEGATEAQKLMLEEFRTKYPKGKPKPPVEPVEIQPTKEELLEKQLLETQAILANLQEQMLLKSGGM